MAAEKRRSLRYWLRAWGDALWAVTAALVLITLIVAGLAWVTAGVIVIP